MFGFLSGTVCPGRVWREQGGLGYALGSNPDCTPGLTRCLDACRWRREALRDNVSFFNWVALYWRELGECPWVTEKCGFGCVEFEMLMTYQRRKSKRQQDVCWSPGWGALQGDAKQSMCETHRPGRGAERRETSDGALGCHHWRGK